MRSRFRPSPAMIVACIALLVALGGTATAVTYVVSSNSQIGPGTISGHKPPNGKHANIIANSINGKDIADRSGVDTCQSPLVKKFGPICAGSDGVARNWGDASDYCSGLGLRLPSISEARALAKKYNVPGVGTGEEFWTDDWFQQPAARAAVVSKSGSFDVDDEAHLHRTVCVTDPAA
jgi:hypothetical protein